MNRKSVRIRPGKLRRAALVTAGYKNLGFFISSALSSQGYTCLMTYRSQGSKAKEVAQKLNGQAYKADLERESDVEKLLGSIEDDGYVVEVLVNNASSFHTGRIIGTDMDEVRMAIEGAIYPTLIPTLYFIPGMVQRGMGRVINIGMAGIGDLRFYSSVALHAAAKTALLSLTGSLAREVRGSGVTVNMISPGIIDRENYDDNDKSQNDLAKGNLVDPKDVAREIIRVVNSPEMNGENIEVGRDPSK